MTVSAAAAVMPKAVARGSMCRSVSLFMIVLALFADAASVGSILLPGYLCQRMCSIQFLDNGERIRHSE
jgi:hypothetical protein